MMRSYDYGKRFGVEVITWQRFAALAGALAEQLAAEQIDCVVGIARAGLFPATAVACGLRRDLYPVRVSRRQDDEVKHPHPVWRVDVSAEVAGKTVAVVDEMADTGETLALVAGRARERDAVRVVTAALVKHSWASPAPDRVALISDALVVFPWDREILADGRWMLHPELADALRQQGVTPDALDRFEE